jgi:hypothetical protein
VTRGAERSRSRDREGLRNISHQYNTCKQKTAASSLSPLAHPHPCDARTAWHVQGYVRMCKPKVCVVRCLVTKCCWVQQRTMNQREPVYYYCNLQGTINNQQSAIRFEICRRGTQGLHGKDISLNWE